MATKKKVVPAKKVAVKKVAAPKPAEKPVAKPVTVTAPIVAVTAVKVVVPFVPKAWRKRHGNDTWHFHPACSNWPTTGDFRGRVERPTTGELCLECLSKSKET